MMRAVKRAVVPMPTPVWRTERWARSPNEPAGEESFVQSGGAPAGRFYCGVPRAS